MNEPDTRRRTYLGRQAIYGSIALIFLGYGIEAWTVGIPDRFAEVGVYPVWWWRIIFSAAFPLTLWQLGRMRPPRWAEGAWLLVGVGASFTRVAQLLDVAYEFRSWSTVLAALLWLPVGVAIIVALDHRSAYRDRE